MPVQLALGAGGACLLSRPEVQGAHVCSAGHTGGCILVTGRLGLDVLAVCNAYIESMIE